MATPGLLHQISAESQYPVEVLGGKAFNLQFLKRNGFNIPVTYVLDVNTLSTGTREEIADSLRIKEGRYAVRSSAISEDGKKFSYAGMFDSFLNVAASDLYEYVMKCEASVNSDRSKAYEAHQHIDHNSSICVIVQEMIDPLFSGICFSQHPVLKNKNIMVIDLAPGLCDKVVSGDVNPISVTVQKGTKFFEVTTVGDFGEFDLNVVTWPMLIQTFLDIESAYGFPVDIEWSVSNNSLVILQARPVTNM